jgi:hypothetical protein
MKKILIVATFFLASCTGDNVKLRERVSYWEHALAQGVPVGASKESAIAWGAKNSVKFDYLAVQNWLYANAEQVPESGIPFPCSSWNIILRIQLGTDGTAVSNNVSQVGSCV